MVASSHRASVISDDATSFRPRDIERWLVGETKPIVVPITLTSVYTDHIALGLVQPTTSPVHRGLRIDAWELRGTQRLDTRWFL